MTTINWSGFSKKSLKEKLTFLAKHDLLTTELMNDLTNNRLLPVDTANQIVENVLGTFSLPFAIAPNFLVDGKTYQLPMVTEEPSVVAAASFAAKLIASSGGFKTEIHNRQMIGQIALYDLTDYDNAERIILENHDKLITLANNAHPSIVKRGGGVTKLWVEKASDVDNTFLVVYFSVDTKEAMGANIVNTMAEALRQPLRELTGGKILMAILSNYATNSLVTATCRIPSHLLSDNLADADAWADKIEKASQFAQIDPYRAATHNKGIFNGIDALVIATGNDWRAMEAGAHAYASKDGQYKGLTRWTFDTTSKELVGTLTLPMPIGTKGGSIGLNPTVQIAMALLGNPTAAELSRLIASLGLAQNLAALKALTGKGIQAGHMKLHAKSLLLLADAKESDIEHLIPILLNEKHLNLETAQKVVNEF
ncbi:hydroxymethylglutaryl-CoA reductase, degradative [Streptococcus fryi]